MGTEFRGDQKKPINSITGSAEQRLIRATIGKVPPWIQGCHLTLTTLLCSAGLIVFWGSGPRRGGSCSSSSTPI
jgi:hypothetical protein